MIPTIPCESTPNRVTLKVWCGKNQGNWVKYCPVYTS